MGNHHSHDAATERSRGGSRRGRSPRGSGAGLSESEPTPQPQPPPPPPSMVPVEKLTKLLVQKSQKEEGVNGVTENIFTKYVFPQYPELARAFVRAAAGEGSEVAAATSTAFRTYCERLLSLLDDALIIAAYVGMFSAAPDIVTPDGFRRLLYTSYKLSMDHHPEGPQTCPLVHQYIVAVVNGCFASKESHSVGFVVRWLQEHCHRVVFPLHRYCVHMLATRHRSLAAGEGVDEDESALQLASPVLEERAGPSVGVGLGVGEEGAGLLPPGAAWLLAAALPALYSLPRTPPAPAAHAKGWLARLVCAVPGHWTPLYRSRDHGLAANRFLHHTLAYRGPTLVLLAAGDATLVVASPQEWRDTHQYWGGPESALLQLRPSFAAVCRAPRSLYLNTTARGYPHGLRFGPDPRKPLLIVDEDFDTLTFAGQTVPLDSIEVWGCGDQAMRETQLDIKKWQVNEAERQRQVKLSAADWMEHPDRYLLELAGRPQYNNRAS